MVRRGEMRKGGRGNEPIGNLAINPQCSAPLSRTLEPEETLKVLNLWSPGTPESDRESRG